MRGWVQSSSELLRELWWKCTTSAECKTDISAALTVMSGLDPHMINYLKMDINHILVIAAQKEKIVVKSFEDVAEF